MILALGVLAIAGALLGIAVGALVMLRVAALFAAAGLGFFSWEVLHVLACAGGGWGLGWFDLARLSPCCSSWGG